MVVAGIMDAVFADPDRAKYRNILHRYAELSGRVLDNLDMLASAAFSRLCLNENPVFYDGLPFCHIICLFQYRY
jgi:hypothetical protein